MTPRESGTANEPRAENPRSGGDPQSIGRCTECHTIYPVQTTADDALRPVGTDGTCTCGNDDFESPSEP